MTRRDIKALRATVMSALELCAFLSPTRLTQNLCARLKPEELLSCKVASLLRKLAIEGKLNCVWAMVPNELGASARNVRVLYAKASQMGMVPGTVDFVFLAESRGFAIELKAETGRQSDNQINYERWCLTVGVGYHICRSVDEVIAALKEEGVLI